MAFRLEVWERAKQLLMSGYRHDEIQSAIEVEHPYLCEYQREDLPQLIKHADRAWAREKKTYDN